MGTGKLKIDLHLHFEGAIRTSTIYDISLEQENIPREIVDMELFDMMDSSSLNTIKSYPLKLEFPISLLQTNENIERVSRELAQDLFLEGILYSEIRLTPGLHIFKGLHPEEIVESVLKGLDSSNLHGTKINVILCAQGYLGVERNIYLIDLVKKFRSRGVIGIDLWGNEKSYSLDHYKKLFNLADVHDIPYTIHAGDILGPKGIWEAIKFNPKRIGNGVRTIEDNKLLNEIKTRNIGLELCPTSNKETKTFLNFKRYPIWDFLNNNIMFSINTDYRTINNSNLHNEVKFLSKYLNINNEILHRININSINSAFITLEEKNKLKEML